MRRVSLATSTIICTWLVIRKLWTGPTFHNKSAFLSHSAQLRSIDETKKSLPKVGGKKGLVINVHWLMTVCAYVRVVKSVQCIYKNRDITYAKTIFLEYYLHKLFLLLPCNYLMINLDRWFSVPWLCVRISMTVWTTLDLRLLSLTHKDQFTRHNLAR